MQHEKINAWLYGIWNTVIIFNQYDITVFIAVYITVNNAVQILYNAF
jgi:hypothetical protein